MRLSFVLMAAAITIAAANEVLATTGLSKMTSRQMVNGVEALTDVTEKRFLRGKTTVEEEDDDDNLGDEDDDDKEERGLGQPINTALFERFMKYDDEQVTRQMTGWLEHYTVNSLASLMTAQQYERYKPILEKFGQVRRENGYDVKRARGS